MLGVTSSRQDRENRLLQIDDVNRFHGSVGTESSIDSTVWICSVSARSCAKIIGARRDLVMTLPNYIPNIHFYSTNSTNCFLIDIIVMITNIHWGAPEKWRKISLHRARIAVCRCVCAIPLVRPRQETRTNRLASDTLRRGEEPRVRTRMPTNVNPFVPEKPAHTARNAAPGIKRATPFITIICSRYSEIQTDK